MLKWLQSQIMSCTVLRTRVPFDSWCKAGLVLIASTLLGHLLPSKVAVVPDFKKKAIKRNCLPVCRKISACIWGGRPREEGGNSIDCIAVVTCLQGTQSSPSHCEVPMSLRCKMSVSYFELWIPKPLASKCFGVPKSFDLFTYPRGGIRVICFQSPNSQ